MADNKKLIERLRKLQHECEQAMEEQPNGEVLRTAEISKQAADTIERLEAERERDAAVLEALRASVADAIDKLAGPLGRAHVRAETGSDQDKELAEVVEQIGVIREAIEPGITEVINALQHAQEQVGEDRD